MNRRDTGRDLLLTRLRDKATDLRARLASLAAANRQCCGSGASVDLVPGGEGLVVACAACQARLQQVAPLRAELELLGRALARYCDCGAWLHSDEDVERGACPACRDLTAW